MAFPKPDNLSFSPLWVPSGSKTYVSFQAWDFDFSVRTSVKKINLEVDVEVIFPSTEFAVGLYLYF
nr:hypothetical protein [Okeania hirsuta]